MNNIILNDLYNSWELYLLRILLISEVVQSRLVGKCIGDPDEIYNIFDPEGYSSEYISIPANPFLGEWELFEEIYPNPITLEGEQDKNVRKTLRQVWRRINEVRKWLGITSHTRFIGEKNKDTRLSTLLAKQIAFLRGKAKTSPIQEGDDKLFFITSLPASKLEKIVKFMNDHHNYDDIVSLW